MDANVSVAVDKKVLKCQTVKRPRLNRRDSVIAEIQPSQVDEIRESTWFTERYKIIQSSNHSALEAELLQG